MHKSKFLKLLSQEDELKEELRQLREELSSIDDSDGDFEEVLKDIIRVRRVLGDVEKSLNTAIVVDITTSSLGSKGVKKG